MKKMPKKLAQPSIHQPPSHDEMGLERLVFFSDAVFAIAITLLALEIRLPTLPAELSDAQLASALFAIWPKYLSYIVSFLVIGLYWMIHHRTFRDITRYDQRLLWLNLLLLMAVAFIPFPTAILGEYGNRASTIFYAATMTVTGFFQASLWLYAKTGGRLLAQPLATADYRRSLLRVLLTSTIFLISIPIALWNSDIAKLFWILVAIVAALR